MNSDTITLAHGSGGTQSLNLISEIFAKKFVNPVLNEFGDSAVFDCPASKLAFTTDSFVVKPLFFPGGDIGKLAVCGTINDLSVAGARPIYLSAGFIIEEGTQVELIDNIARSMANTAHLANVLIVAGDTKVVEKGGCDTLFITTAGIGKIIVEEPITASRVCPGDAILLSRAIGDHGIAIMASREGLSFETLIESDCALLNTIVETLIGAVPKVRFMRDATRGGLATVLNEVTLGQKFGIEVEEKNIPVHNETLAACEILGLEPLYIANEGTFLAIVPAESAYKALTALRSHPQGREAAIIGRVTKENAGRVHLITSVGSSRRLAMLSGAQLPRIC